MLDPRKSKKMVNGNPSRESQKNILGVLKKSCSYACTTCNKQIFGPQSTPARTQPRKHADDSLTPMGVGCLMEAWRCHLHAPKRVGHICSEKTHTTKKSSLPSLSSHNLCQQNIIYGLVTKKSCHAGTRQG